VPELKNSLGITMLLAVLVAASVGYLIYRSWTNSSGISAADEVLRGGEIRVTYRSEPRSFNRFVSAQLPEEVITRLTQATLVRLNRATGQIEPHLAREWTVSPDGLTWTFSLEEGVTFSDGTPLTSADVLFSFRALYDPQVKSEIASSLRIGGKPMEARALDASTVVVVLPAPYGPGIALLDALPIYPQHKLGPALDAGQFRDAWGVTTPLSDLAGLGPFVIGEFVPGERLVFVRNPRYWRRDQNNQPLPYLDRIVLHFVADQNTEVLRLRAGEVDLMTDRVRFEDLTSLQALARDGRLTLHDAGVSIAPDMFWFNLSPTAESAQAKPWLQRDELRLAIAHAVNREALINTVFLGEAEEVSGPITPGHGPWYLPDLPRPALDLERAVEMLKGIGLTDRDGDSVLEDSRGRPAQFSVLTQKGHSVRERSAVFIQEQLRRIGLKVDIVPLETRSMISRWGANAYEAMYFAIEFDSFDPGRHQDFWTSSGAFHLWHPRQNRPATTWEARIDALMARQTTSLDPVERLQIFADVQRVFAEHLPVLPFAAPKVIVATSSRVRGITPSVLAPNVLWSAEAIWVDRPAEPPVR
jgi:peptide/nickel transport system substrate-binding protein